jgi:AraC-like DNA-binding protein
MPVGDLLFLRGQYVRRCTHDIAKHFDDYATLQYMQAGAVELSIADESWRLEGRWFWSAWPGPRVSFHAAAGTRSWVHRFVAFRGPAVDRWMKEGLFPVRPQRPASAGAARTFDRLLKLIHSADLWQRRKAVHLLEGMLIDLAAARRASRPLQLAPLLRRLEAAPAASPVDYAALAADEGMSVRTLRRQFHKATGMSPHDYLLSRRMQEAKQLLYETELPIKEIARRLGYRDVYYFTRQFARRAGSSPARYRRSWVG